MSISHHHIAQTVIPLRLIFWGALICLFDFTFAQKTNGTGWKCDVINDLIGMLMITGAVYKLGKIPVHDRYRKAMLFVTVMAVLSCLHALHDHFVYRVPSALSFCLSIQSALAMVATVVFCLAMRWLCREAGMERSERSWKITTGLFTCIYLIPLGLFYCAVAIAIVTENSFSFQFGPAGLLLLPVFCIPLVHLFLSTSRMKADAESMACGD
jgi:hypothetical protein